MSASAPSYKLVTSLDELRPVIARVIADGLPFGFDIETGYEGEPRPGAAVHPEENFVTGISFTNSLNWAVYVPVRHDAGVNLPNQETAELFWALLQTGLGVAHNAGFELRCMSRWFMEYLSAKPDVRSHKGYFPVLSDTLIERYIEAKHETYALKPMTKAVFGHQMMEIMELFPDSLTEKQKKSIRFNVLDQHESKVYAYAGEDSVWCLAHHLDPAAAAVRQQFLYKVEMQILPILCAMEDFGVKYDWNFMREGAARGRSFRERLQMEVQADLQNLIAERTGVQEPLKINLGSPPQLAKVLFERLGLRTTVLTKGDKDGNRKMSTGKIALKGLSMQYPAVKKILNWKNLSRLIGTYLEKYEPAYNYADDGLTHPSHMQCAVVSGRFAVAGPPYQQSPKKYHYELNDGTSFDFNFRDAIVAPPGYYILGFDYSQIELRVIAGEANETALLEAFAAGEDVHSRTASLMLGIPLDQCGPGSEARSIGKTMNFALMYQMGVDGLADRLGISLEEAEELFNQYFSVYSNIHQWIKNTVNNAKAAGFTTSRFGRRHPIWEFKSTIRYIYAKGERLAGNAPIQGGAADYMKVAMVRADKALEAAGLKDDVVLFMNIHDALEFYVKDHIKPKQVIDVLTPAIIFPVEGWPAMEAEWHAGRRWGSVKDLEVLPDGLRVKGSDDTSTQVIELDGEVEDEDGPVLPAVDVTALRSRLGKIGEVAEPEDYSELVSRIEADVRILHGPATVIASVPAMPSGESYGRLLALVAAQPGANKLVLRTPEGDVTVSEATSVGPAHQGTVSVLLGGAEVTYAPESVDTGALSEGLSL